VPQSVGDEEGNKKEVTKVPGASYDVTRWREIGSAALTVPPA
jgi:hypothetical protein